MPAGVAGVTFDGIDSAVFYLFDDADMIGSTVGASGGGFVPVKEDDHAGSGFSTIIHPLPSLFEPADTIDTAGELGNDTSIDVAAFICTPGNKAGTPFNTGVKTVPGPIRFAAYIANLRQGNGNDLIVCDITNCIKFTINEVSFADAYTID